jgi:hypothetical protein
MPQPEPLARHPTPADRVPAGTWALLAGAVVASLVLTPLGALLAVAGVVRERRAGRDLTAAAFGAVALADLVLLAAVGLSLVVATAVPVAR